jgi:hypothetical protein
MTKGRTLLPPPPEFQRGRKSTALKYTRHCLWNELSFRVPVLWPLHCSLQCRWPRRCSLEVSATSGPCPGRGTAFKTCEWMQGHQHVNNHLCGKLCGRSKAWDCKSHYRQRRLYEFILFLSCMWVEAFRRADPPLWNPTVYSVAHSPQGRYTGRAITAAGRVSADFCGKRVLSDQRSGSIR